jgi:hypothetical protein
LAALGWWESAPLIQANHTETEDHWSIDIHWNSFWKLDFGKDTDESWWNVRVWQDLDRTLKKDLTVAGRFEPGPIAEVAKGDLSGFPGRLREGGFFEIGRDQMRPVWTRTIQWIWFEGKIYRKPWFLPWSMGGSCKFYRKPIHWMIRNFQRENDSRPLRWIHLSLCCKSGRCGECVWEIWGIPSGYLT